MADNKFIVLDNLTYYNEKIQEQTQQIQQKTTELDNSKVNRSGDNITGSLNVEGALTLPNSPDTPDTASVTDTYTTRQTANAAVTGLTVVDGSDTIIESIKGNTVATASKNLIPFPYIRESYSAVGITFTVNEDGSVHISGTSTGYASFDLNSISLPTGVPYYLSSNYDKSKCFLCIGYTLSGTNAQIGEYSGKAVALPAGAISKKVYLQVNPGITIDATVYPMVSLTELPYQRYSSELKNSYISGIKSTGRNLFDISKLQTTTTGIVNNEDGTLSISMYSARTKETLSTLCPSLKVGDVVTFSFTTTALDRQFINLSNSATSFIQRWDNNTSKEITEEMLEATILFYNNSSDDTEVRVVSNIQIERGTVATNYMPYIDENIYQLPETLELGIGDSVNLQTGELTRTTVTRSFNGTENWTYYNSVANHFQITVENNEYGQDINPVVSNFSYVTDKVKNTYYSTLSRAVMSVNGNRIRFKDASFSDVSSWKSYLAKLYAAGTPLTITYKLATPLSTRIIDAPKSYVVYNNGTETIVQGEVDNSIYGANPTITQTYSIHENPTEAANKAYVNNGLATKLDKRGGIITGNLIVEGVTDTALGAIVSKKNDVSYGLTYDGDAYKLGQGTVNEDGDFSYNEGEGLPITLRSDSNEFLNNNLVKWDSDGNKIVDSGLSAITVATKDDIPTIYTSASTDSEAELITTKTLKIYVDADGYLHIDTTETE